MSNKKTKMALLSYPVHFKVVVLLPFLNVSSRKFCSKLSSEQSNFHSNEVDQIHSPGLAQWCGYMPSSNVTRVDTIIMWVEFVVSLLCSERLFCRNSSFPLVLTKNKFNDLS